MSTLEKTIGLLEALPDNKIETVYAFVRFIGSQDYESTNESLSERQKRYSLCLELPMNMQFQHLSNKKRRLLNVPLSKNMQLCVLSYHSIFPPT